jgi:hypothetical protein
MQRRFLPFLVALVVALLQPHANAEAPSAKPLSARVVGVTGDVRTQAQGESLASPVQLEQAVPAGTHIVVAPGGFVSLRLPDGSLVRLYPNTKVSLESLTPGRASTAPSKPTVLKLDGGSLDAEVTRKQVPTRRFEVRSDLAVAGVRGTSFSVTVDGDKRFVGHVREGVVAVQSLSTKATVELRAGKGVAVDPNRGLGDVFALLPVVPDVPIAPLRVDESALLDIRYSPVSGAVGYQLQVARDEAMTQVLRNGFFEKPQAVFRGLPAGNYFISVRAVDIYGARGAEALQALVVKPRALAPVLLLPDAGPVKPGSGGDIHCGVITGSSSYRIQMARDVDFKNKVLDAPGQDQCRVANLTDLSGYFFWRAAAELPGDASSLGAWSQMVPVRLARGVLEEIQRLDDAVPQAEGALPLRYQVQVSTHTSFEPLVLDHISPDTSLPLDMPNGQYYVRWKVVIPEQGDAEFSLPQVVTLQR